jgi:hypothetical protein
MRKLITILGFFLLTLSVSGQIINASATYRAQVSAGGYPEMINHGDFAGITQSSSVDGTYWYTGASWTIADGKAYYDDLNNYSGLMQSDVKMLYSIEINTDYTLSFDVSDSPSGLRINWVSQDQDVDYITDGTYSNGHHALDWTSPADVGSKGLRLRTYTSGSSGYITNISLKQR